jgi:hypothetical protein
MSLTVELPADLEAVLADEAAQTGTPLPEYVIKLLSIGRIPKLRNGSELVAYWEKEGIIGSRMDITDPAAHARELRKRAETREWDRD